MNTQATGEIRPNTGETSQKPAISPLFDYPLIIRPHPAWMPDRAIYDKLNAIEGDLETVRQTLTPGSMLWYVVDMSHQLARLSRVEYRLQSPGLLETDTATEGQ